MHFFIVHLFNWEWFASLRIIKAAGFFPCARHTFVFGIDGFSYGPKRHSDSDEFFDFLRRFVWELIDWSQLYHCGDPL